MSQNKSGKFPSIFGYMEENERVALQMAVLVTTGVQGDALEIGSLNGLSACLILSVLQFDKLLTCIEKECDETLQFNITKLTSLTGGSAQIIQNDFKEVPISPPLQKLSFVFIDHSHTYDDNIAAFEKFWPCVTPGGVLSFHDYRDPNWMEGTRAIDDLISKHKLIPCVSGGSFVGFKKP